MKTILYLLAASLLAAQNAAPASASWEKAAALRAGRTVRVQTGAERYDGTLVSVSDSALALRLPSGSEVSVNRQEIQRIAVPKSSHRMRNTIIGSAVGVAVGVVIYGTLGAWFRNEGNESTEYMLAVPIAIGTGIGAALPSGGMKTIYDARP